MDQANNNPPGYALMEKLVEELVLLRKAVTELREVNEALQETLDETIGWHEVLARAVELMHDSKKKPGWEVFLDAYDQAFAEVFGDDEGGDAGDDDEEPPSDGSDGSDGPVRKRRRFFTSG